MINLVETAIEYARAGFRILPVHNPIIHDEGVVCSCLKQECKSIGKHPRGHGRTQLRVASTNEDEIRSLWNRWPSANIGICTDGFTVIDIDPVRLGSETWEAISGHRDSFIVPEVHTGSGGRHLFYRDDTRLVPNSIDRIGVGIDVRAMGGYVVAPPSLHQSGRRYAWEDIMPSQLSRVSATVPMPMASDYPPLPDWLREKCVNPSGTERGTEYAEDVTSGAGF